jgi:hypothetical protein
LDQKWLKLQKNSLRLDIRLLPFIHNVLAMIRKRRNSNVKTTSLL